MHQDPSVDAQRAQDPEFKPNFRLIAGSERKCRDALLKILRVNIFEPAFSQFLFQISTCKIEPGFVDVVA